MGFFSQPKNSVPSISVADFLAMREKKEPYTLIDVRDQSEWDAGHIEEAKLIPLVVLGLISKERY